MAGESLGCLAAMRRRTACLLVAFTVAAGCGGDDAPAPADREPGGGRAVQPLPDPSPAAGSGGRVVAVSAVPGGEPAFEQEALRADPGRVRFEFTNPSQTSHALCIESPEQGALGCTSQFRGDSATLALRVPAGAYTYFCNVSGHREAGMAGRLTVR